MLLLAFMLRAMIAAGYMPASAAPGDLGMTMCIHGLSAGTLKVLALHDTPISAEPRALDCAFGAVVVQPVLPVFAGLALAAVLTDVHQALWRAMAPAFTQPWQGPPLGARGPPLAAR